MKKFLSFILALLLLFSFTYYGNTGKINNAIAKPMVSNVTVLVSPPQPSTNAQYTINFTPGQTLPAGTQIQIINITLGNTSISNITYTAVTVNTASLTSPITIVPSGASTYGNTYTFILTTPQQLQGNVSASIVFTAGAGLINPLAGSFTLNVYIQADSSPQTAISNSYIIGSAQITGLSVTPDPTMTGSVAKYAVNFTTSSLGALTANVDEITLQFPSGTTIPTPIATVNVPGYFGYVKVNNYPLTSLNSYLTLTGTTLKIKPPLNIGNSSTVSVVIESGFGIQNPLNQGTYQMTVFTSKDSSVVNASYNITSSSVLQPTVLTDPSTASAVAQYTLTFNISTTGALTGGVDKIYVTFPTGTYVPTTIQAQTVTVNGTNSLSVVYGPSSNTLQVTLPQGVNIQASGSISLVFTAACGIKNPQTGGSFTLSVYTSKDLNPVVSKTYTITTSTLEKASVTVNPAIISQQASWIIQFKTGSGGALQANDTITIVFPATSTLPISITPSYVKIGTVSPSSITVNTSTKAMTLTLPVGFVVGGGQSVSIIIDKATGIKNPSTPSTSYVLKISTSKETSPVDSNPFSIFGAATSSITVNPANPNGKNNYYTTQPVVTITVDNPGGGKADIYYKFSNETQYRIYTSPITIPEGNITLYYYSQDSYGNKETEKSKNFLVDITPPSLSVTAPKEGAVYYQATITVSGVAQGANSLTVNGNNFTLDQNGLFNGVITLAKEGNNIVSVVAEDIAGNKTQKDINVKYISRVTMLLQVGNKFVYVNNEQKEIDAPPFIDKKTGRVMVPLRFVAEYFKADVIWDSIFQIVTLSLNGKTIRVQVGNKNADVSGKLVILDAPPVIVSGRVFVPLRFVAENFGAQVTWDPLMQIVNIIYPKP